ncbi:MAG TPA: hypothetical protein VIV11_24600 [Kofleriaceae bacterium]
MRGLLIVPIALVLVVGCKGKKKQEPAAGSGSGSKVDVKIDWAKCEQAIDKAAGAPLAARPMILIQGCQACGRDWTPLLQWNTDPATGGPKREQIEALLVACDAFCTGDSKQKFVLGVDKVRGQGVNTPWRQLAKACEAKVNGSPDDRFMSAPFFALDRIARAVAAKGGATADKLAAIELPLPAVTITGAGVILPDSESVTPKVGELQITVLGAEMYIGRMPRAKLTAAGVVAQLGDKGYPGEKVETDKLGAKLRELVGDDKTQTITILAPHAMPAVNVVPVIAAASAVAPVYLAANAHEAPEGWQLAGAIPIALEAGDQIKVTGEMTVQNLARELAAHVARKLDRVGVTKP